MDEVQEFMMLKKSIAELSDKKIRVEERFKNEKARLEKILTEVTAKGYDPKNISEIRKQKQDLFKTQVEKLKSQVQETENKLNLIEA
jgi:uncharacterized Fe-S cluster-containing radical SAM superfamily protein